MPTFLAANNLTISSEDHSWRLYNGRGDEGSPIVEAGPDGLRYQSAFASARRLSPDGRLPVGNIGTVVVGWAVEDSSWHLGILLTPDIAQTRGARWCGLARWNTYEGGEAEQAGAALAATLNKPFRFVPPSTPQPVPIPPPVAEPLPAAPTEWPSTPAPLKAPSAVPTETAQLFPGVPTIPLMPLPIAIGDWVFQEHPQGLVWVKAQSWRTKTLIYGVLSIGLGFIFAALSLGARFSPYAPVQPDYLPLVGLAIAVILFAIGLWQVSLLLRATSVVIDNRQRMVRVMRGTNRTVIQSPYEGLEYLLISHMLSRREAISNPDPQAVTYDRVWSEVWIHLFSPRRGFIPVCYADHTEGRVRSHLAFDQRRPLRLDEIDTPAHHAAQMMADLIKIPAFVEER